MKRRIGLILLVTALLLASCVSNPKPASSSEVVGTNQLVIPRDSDWTGPEGSAVAGAETAGSLVATTNDLAPRDDRREGRDQTPPMRPLG